MVFRDAVLLAQLEQIKQPQTSFEFDLFSCLRTSPAQGARSCHLKV